MVKHSISPWPVTCGVPGTLPAWGCEHTVALVNCFSAPASCSWRICLTVAEDATSMLSRSAVRPLGPFTIKSFALELLATLQPEGRATEATWLEAVRPPELPGMVVVVPVGVVVEVAAGEVVD